MAALVALFGIAALAIAFLLLHKLLYKPLDDRLQRWAGPVVGKLIGKVILAITGSMFMGYGLMGISYMIGLTMDCGSPCSLFSHLLKR